MRSSPFADAVRLGLCALAVAQLSLGATRDTATPIKHVIVIIGEKIGRAHV